MPENKIITVNGRQYDAVTGMPIAKAVKEGAVKPSAKPAAKPANADVAKATAKPVVKPTAKSEAKKAERVPHSVTSAKAVHSAQQRSVTLRRASTKKPATVAAKHPTRGRSMDIARSDKISKFAPHPVIKPAAKPAPKPTAVADRPAKTHPVVTQAQAKKPLAPAKPAAKSSKAVKDEAIAKALSVSTPKPKKSKKVTLSPWKRRAAIIGLCIVALFGIAWAVYRFIPSVSVSIAASQAGVRATYPEYIPDGFSLHQPVAYNEGEVILVFRSNTNDDSYSITQTKSSWDSSAVLDNVVRKAVGENYITTTERGLTIYSYDTSASWVNGGVLYTVESDAHLSTEQIRRIATSL